MLFSLTPSQRHYSVQTCLHLLLVFFCIVDVLLKRPIWNKSLSLFCWLIFTVFMNFDLAMATARKMLTLIDRIKKAPFPSRHFKHFGNNGAWCDWINEVLPTVKRAHIFYINLIIFAWQKEKKGGRVREEKEREIWISVGISKRRHQSVLYGGGVHRVWCFWLGLALALPSCLPCLA